MLSAALNDALLQTAVQGEQAIVLLNRRGFSTFVMCRDCGESIVCPHCAVALVYHSAGEAMRCHYCGNTAPIPDECPNCHSRRIRFLVLAPRKQKQKLPNCRKSGFCGWIRIRLSKNLRMRIFLNLSAAVNIMCFRYADGSKRT